MRYGTYPLVAGCCRTSRQPWCFLFSCWIVPIRTYPHTSDIADAVVVNVVVVNAGSGAYSTTLLQRAEWYVLAVSLPAPQVG
jgi:hypothetical protein